MTLAETYSEVDSYLTNLLCTENTNFFNRLEYVRKRYQKGAYYREAKPLIREGEELLKEV